MRPDPDSLRALLTLKAAPGLGDQALGRMLARHGSATAALGALAAHKPAAAASVRTPAVRGWIDRALETVAALDVAVLTPGSAFWPAFEGLHDPPPVLFAIGDLALLGRLAVAVVGSRRHTEYGVDVTRGLAGDLARAGIVVASGLAHGIDRHAHQAALESGGSTFAVIGCGIDVEYPPANAALQRQIARDGLLLSEFLPGQPALPHHFPKRNRLLAALTAATVVIEAAGRSGSLITADHAMELGRDVFAVPGPIGRPTSEGTNRLIRDGAQILTDTDDLLLALGRPFRERPGPGPNAPDPGPDSEPGRTVWIALEAGPVHVDDLARSAGIDPATTLATLLAMELTGQVRQLPGKRFGRAA